MVSCCAFGFRNRHGESEGLGFYRFHRGFMQVGSGHKEKELKPSKHLRICGNHFSRPVKSLRNESKRVTKDVFKLFEEWNDRFEKPAGE